MDKVSIIVPIYNGEKYLKRCIDSLINQTYNNIEIILVNDGSIDNTINIIKKYKKQDNRIVVIDKINTGVSDSRNMAIDKSSGKYICFCDADDYYKKNYVELMIKTLKENNVSAVKCNYRVINSNNKEIGIGNTYFKNKKIQSNDLIPLLLNGKVPCFVYLLMIRKDKINNKFPNDIAMMEDVVFYIELLSNLSEIYILDKTLYTIMFNNEGATNNIKNYERNIKNIVLVNKYIKDILKKNNLLNVQNIENININNLNAIADFIFRYYLNNNNAVILCKKINNSQLKQIIKKTNLSNIDLARRIILHFLYKDNYILLNIYFNIRKIIYKWRHK